MGQELQHQGAKVNRVKVCGGSAARLSLQLLGPFDPLPLGVEKGSNSQFGTGGVGTARPHALSARRDRGEFKASMNRPRRP